MRNACSGVCVIHANTQTFSFVRADGRVEIALSLSARTVTYVNCMSTWVSNRIMVWNAQTMRPS